ncbi:MAG: hypothetical protein CMJ64_26305 [Planctomycetaceae bacterium]|nr:hypothetical protein [Planctomycetaceae bacterium]
MQCPGLLGAQKRRPFKPDGSPRPAVFPLFKIVHLNQLVTRATDYAHTAMSKESRFQESAIKEGPQPVAPVGVVRASVARTDDLRHFTVEGFHQTSDMHLTSI